MTATPIILHQYDISPFTEGAKDAGAQGPVLEQR